MVWKKNLDFLKNNYVLRTPENYVSWHANHCVFTVLCLNCHYVLKSHDKQQQQSNCTVLSTVLHCTALYCTILYCTVLYCTALYCTALYCTELYCTALYRIIQQEIINNGIIPIKTLPTKKQY